MFFFSDSSRAGDGGFDDAAAQLATGAIDLGGDLALGVFLEALGVGFRRGHDAHLLGFRFFA